MMKKSVILVLAFMNILNFSGCPFNTQNEKEYDPRYSIQSQDRVYNEETLKEILECFDNKDADTLITIFSEAVKSECDLKSQIETAFEIYGGKSVSYEGFFDWGYSTMETRDGICVEKSVSADIKNVKTDANEFFRISFVKCVVNDDNPAQLGVTSINLMDPEYGSLAVIGPVSHQGLQILEENNQKRNSNKSLGSN